MQCAFVSSFGELLSYVEARFKLSMGRAVRNQMLRLTFALSPQTSRPPLLRACLRFDSEVDWFARE
jgi:hypothetical protein